MGDILFLAHRIPYPPDRGDKIRSWHLLKHLGTIARVHLACFADDEADAAHLDALRDAMRGSLGQAHVEVRRTSLPAAAARAILAGKPISLTSFDSSSLRGFVNRLLGTESIGTIFAFSGQMAQFVPSGRHRFVMDFGDMDSAKFADYAGKGSGAMRWVNRREAQRLFAFERSVAARADASLFVSESEAALFRSSVRLPGADIRALSNGIDLAFFDPAAAFEPAPRAEGPLLVFTGQMDYRPNVEAAVSFARDVMPTILGERADARFAVVGRNPTEAVRRLDGVNGTFVTGQVPDVRSWLAAADVVVAPLAIARGIQNKVLEAMAMARPVVASRPAWEGIEAVPGAEILVADGSADQARLVLDLLRHPDRGRAIGAAARAKVESAYRWDVRLAPLGDIVAPGARKAAA
jgi:sugar transferase (PEP-CTERM/EpsH1 system associated)